MTTKNDITGDLIKTRAARAEEKRNFDEGWDRIFGNKKDQVVHDVPTKEDKTNNE